jgi:hypothetical protein
LVVSPKAFTLAQTASEISPFLVDVSVGIVSIIFCAPLVWISDHLATCGAKAARQEERTKRSLLCFAMLVKRKDQRVLPHAVSKKRRKSRKKTRKNRRNQLLPKNESDARKGSCHNRAMNTKILVWSGG